MTLDVKVTGAHQLYELNRKLREANKKLPAKLRKGIRDGAKPAVRATKAAVLAIPVKNARGGGRSQRQSHHFERSKGKDEEKRRTSARRRSGLRRTIAGAIKVQIRTGAKTAAVRILVDEKQLPPDQRTLPRHLDSPNGWRHPTFGRDPWTHQQGRPWFETTIRRHLAEVRSAVLKAMDEIANEIERGV
ncbi:hypothetical protein N5079_19815 [Planotetraspora sp. A-T 1434]|uniref:hypothetical protein n=1 Tax=Planotetraspora sp. A-T 1434 TaxID=2979219 RepID=UPI0021C0A2DC|nr:hypothetical protein [Planotetraspora sp. A-T 1434]MCT9932452.1 hypothetical protein [Planotetraspora sp. A-T 1434]